MTLSFEQMLAISDSFDQEEDEMMSFTCLSCGFTEDVPKWVIDEQADMDFFAGADKASYIPSTTCMKCNGSMQPTHSITTQK